MLEENADLTNYRIGITPTADAIMERIKAEGCIDDPASFLSLPLHHPFHVADGLRQMFVTSFPASAANRSTNYGRLESMTLRKGVIGGMSCAFVKLWTTYTPVKHSLIPTVQAKILETLQPEKIFVGRMVPFTFFGNRDNAAHSRRATRRRHLGTFSAEATPEVGDVSLTHIAQRATRVAGQPGESTTIARPQRTQTAGRRGPNDRSVDKEMTPIIIEQENGNGIDVCRLSTGLIGLYTRGTGRHCVAATTRRRRAEKRRDSVTTSDQSSPSTT